MGPSDGLKRDALLSVASLAYFQQRHKRQNIPYTKEDTIFMLDIRYQTFKANSITRNGLTQKYSRELILSESDFVKDIDAWKENRMRGIRRLHSESHED